MYGLGKEKADTLRRRGIGRGSNSCTQEKRRGHCGWVQSRVEEMDKAGKWVADNDASKR